jgi:GTP-binding protein HflX
LFQFEASNGLEQAVLVGVIRPDQTRWQVDEHLDELAFLADTAGAEIKGRLIQKKAPVDSAFFIGRGKVEELNNYVQEVGAVLIIFDDDLAPVQIKNVEKICGCKVIDRSGLILDIFARRAKTREARTQVELAQLRYLLPRLTRQWTHLSRQVGGIGTKGPGETQLEVDRRQIRIRIRHLSEELEKIQREQNIRRKRREDIYKVALIGYTNVGKSTLLNILTESSVFVEDRLFATLDPTVRNAQFAKSRPILLIDTVGFIRKLPHDLIASFRSTLAEAAEADLLIHVIDVSHPVFMEQITTVLDVLKTLKIDDRPILNVFNKIDKVREPGLINRLIQDFPNAVPISAARGMFIEKLKQEIINFAESEMVETEIVFNFSQNKIVAKAYEMVRVLERQYLDSQIILKIRGEKWKVEQIKNLADQNV